MLKAVSGAKWLLHRLCNCKQIYYRMLTSTRRLSGHLRLSRGACLRVPLRCDGKGFVELGAGTMLGWPGAYRFGDGCIMLQARTPNATVRVGKNCRFSNNISMIATESIEIGDGCLIGDLVSIMDSDFHGIAPAQRHSGSFKTAPVKLGNNVWLGSRVLVLKGVTIGETSVVAAGSIVTSSLPPNCIAAGVPARALRMIDVGPGHTG